MKKALVLYYSFEGHTKELAESMAKKIDADVLEIKPVKEIKSKGFGKFFWGGKQALMGDKPELESFNNNLNDYQLIFIGTPVWAGTYAPPIKTILEGSYVQGRKLAFFCTHEGGPGKVMQKAQKSIEMENIYLGGLELKDVKKHMDESVSKACQWAEGVIQDI